VCHSFRRNRRRREEEEGGGRGGRGGGRRTPIRIIGEGRWYYWFLNYAFFHHHYYYYYHHYYHHHHCYHHNHHHHHHYYYYYYYYYYHYHYQQDFTEGASTEEDEEESSIADESLHRLCESLQGKTLLPLLSSLLPPHLSSPDWRKRRVAMVALTAMVEQCSKAIKPRLNQTIGTVMTMMKDPHPRVVAQSLTCLSSLCEAFPTTTQTTSHTQAVPVLASLIAEANR